MNSLNYNKMRKYVDQPTYKLAGYGSLQLNSSVQMDGL